MSKINGRKLHDGRSAFAVLMEAAFGKSNNTSNGLAGNNGKMLPQRTRNSWNFSLVVAFAVRDSTSPAVHGTLETTTERIAVNTGRDLDARSNS